MPNSTVEEIACEPPSIGTRATSNPVVPIVVKPVTAVPSRRTLAPVGATTLTQFSPCCPIVASSRKSVGARKL